MSQLFSRKFNLRTGETLLVREGAEEDAAVLVVYINTVAGESDNLTYGPGDFKASVEQEAAIIEALREAPNQTILVAVIEGEIIGLLTVHAEERPRLRHVGEFGLTIRKAHWGKGIGNILMQCMLDWAKASGVIRKLNLVVNVDNENAIRLYKKFGFEIEGRTRRDLFIDGRFVDSYSMGVLID